MKPTTRVILYFAIVTTGYSSSVIIGDGAIRFHSYVLMAIAVIVAILATFFASSSRFAKEVRWIYRWRRVVKRPIEEYPQTPQDVVNIRWELYPKLEKLGMAVNRAREKLTAARLRHKAADIVANLEAEDYICRSRFLIYWSVLRHVKALPIDPRSGQPWNNHLVFLSFLEKRATAMEVAYA